MIHLPPLKGKPVGRKLMDGRNAENSLQQSIVEILMADGIEVFDGNNRKPNPPYVVIGEALTSGNNTKDTIGYDHNITLNVWSNESGSMETKYVTSRIIDLLINNGNIPLSDGYCVIKPRLDHVRYLPADNSATNIQRAMVYLDFRTKDMLFNRYG